jgi:hypothetical protein
VKQLDSTVEQQVDGPALVAGTEGGAGYLVTHNPLVASTLSNGTVQWSARYKAASSHEEEQANRSAFMPAAVHRESERATAADEDDEDGDRW